MKEKTRVAILVLIMALVSMAVLGTAIISLYRVALEEEREILVSMARSQASLIEEMVDSSARLEPDYPGGPEKATLDRLVEAHRGFGQVGSTGEFTVARLEGENIVFLLSRRYYDVGKPHSVPMRSNLAEPMRLALSGESGYIVGLDYRGVRVLAAYEPVAGTDWGIVAKVDVGEIRDPFLRAGALTLLFATVFILLGRFMFVWITNPIIGRLKGDAERLTNLVVSLHQSEGKLQEVNEELETRVRARTAELVSANDRLEAEVSRRAHAEERLRALWKTAELINAEDRELFDHILHGAIQMTQSRYAFYGFLNSDESVMTMYSWSKEAFDECGSTSNYPVDCSVSEGGIWAEAIRQRRVIIINDCEAEAAGKRGFPSGHVLLKRLLSVPVFIHDRIAAIVSTANKATDYTPEDVKQIERFAAGVQIILDQRKTELALRKSEKECRLLSRQVIEAQEIERKRVAREIHDGIGQSLAALKFHTEHFSLMSSGEPAAREGQLNSTIHMIQETMEEVRRIQNDLRPAYLDELGVLETISDFCEKFEETYPDMRVALEVELSEKDVPESLKAPMYRISQEAMNNAARHSGADQVKVYIGKREQDINLIIVDEGVGFSQNHGKFAESDRSRRGLGLYSMRERAELSGGILEIESAPGKGTAIRATWHVEGPAVI